MNVLQRLRDTAARPAYERDAERRYLLLFSRSGFTPELKRELKRDHDVRLIGPAELLGHAPEKRARRTRKAR
jgi:hypothetical protein